MNFDIVVSPSSDLQADAALIKLGEELGFAAAWSLEAGRNPFFSLTVAAAQTNTVGLGSYAASAFERSPMVVAQIAWDLARQSNGRFMLGLGLDYLESDGGVPGGSDNERLSRMREYIESLRAIWNTFQNDARLRYRGEYYTFRLMAPFFNPGPIDHPDIPIFLAGVNLAQYELAAECCRGMHAPWLHNAAYLRNAILPAIKRGLSATGRERSDFELALPVAIVSGFTAAELCRAKESVAQEIASAVMAASNRHFVQSQGLTPLADDLRAAARAGRQADLKHFISDRLLDEVAIVAEPHDVRGRISERYGGMVDRVCLCMNLENSVILESIFGA